MPSFSFLGLIFQNIIYFLVMSHNFINIYSPNAVYLGKKGFYIISKHTIDLLKIVQNSIINMKPNKSLAVHYYIALTEWCLP